VPPGDNRGATHGKIIFKEFDSVRFHVFSFWFSMLEYKKAMLILLEGNIEDHYLRRFLTSSELSHMISTLDSMACNMECMLIS